MPSLDESSARFADTRWSVVLGAAGTGNPASRAALDALCRIYWPPLYAFARRQGLNAPDAQDAVQGFLADLIGRESLRAIDRMKGTFRAFLAAGLRHFLANEWAAQRRLKRGGAFAFVSFEDLGPEPAGPAEALSPEVAFDRQWALAVVTQARQRLRASFEKLDRLGHYERLEPFLLGAHASYEESAAALGLSVPALKSAVHRLRLDLRKAMREEVARTVSDPREVDTEMRYLYEVLQTAD